MPRLSLIWLFLIWWAAEEAEGRRGVRRVDTLARCCLWVGAPRCPWQEGGGAHVGARVAAPTVGRREASEGAQVDWGEWKVGKQVQEREGAMEEAGETAGAKAAAVGGPGDLQV